MQEEAKWDHWALVKHVGVDYTSEGVVRHGTCNVKRGRCKGSTEWVQTLLPA
jgi:hypothetical protein